MDFACFELFEDIAGLLNRAFIAQDTEIHPGIELLQLLIILWTLPNTLLGVTAGVVGICFGGKCQRVRGCLEFYDGLVGWLLRRGPLSNGIMAMTLGHSILGQTRAALDIARDHEHVHVRQYERWGPFFLPAYLGCSCALWLMRKDAYRDNPFEIEAYAIADFSKPANDGSTER